MTDQDTDSYTVPTLMPGAYQTAPGASSRAFRRVYGTFVGMQEAFVFFEDDLIVEIYTS